MQAILEIFVIVKNKKVAKTRGFSKRRRRRDLNVVLNLVKTQKGGKDVIVARGKLRDDRPIKKKTGSSRFGRARSTARLLKFQFIVTNLSPRSDDGVNNFTERSKYSKLSEWNLPSFDVALTCVRSDIRRPILCPNKAVKITDSRLVLRIIREGG